MKIIVAVKNFVEVRWTRKFKTKEKLQKYQERKIKKQLEYMKKNSPYYKDIDVNKLEEIPIIDKKIMMDNFNEMNTVGLDRDTALKIAIDSEHTRDFETKYNGISVGLSSGTSGHRGLFVLSDKETCQWAGAILAKLLPKGDLFGHRVAFFLRADNNLYETINSKFIKFKFFDLLKNMDTNIEQLETYNPSILVAPASVLKTIAKSKVKINPKKIISVAEVLNDADERYLKKAFNKDIIYEVYQCTEGFLAYTCECGNSHINEDIVKIEKEQIDEKRFVPIITDFYRKSQPIIRYRLNDVLVSSGEKCKCGSPMMVIDKIEGREDDIFVFKNRLNNENVLVYADFISRCLVYVDDIEDYRVVQKAINEITIYIDNISDDTKKSIINEFKRLSEKMNFEMPQINFEKYQTEKGKKVKRIERGFVYEKL